jgi:hypothetical protein
MKKIYIKPEVTRVAIDNTISLVMMSKPPHPPHPPKPPKPKGAFDSPFDSPFN